MFGGEYLLKNNPYKDTAIPVAQFTAEGGYYFKKDTTTTAADKMARVLEAEAAATQKPEI